MSADQIEKHSRVGCLPRLLTWSRAVRIAGKQETDWCCACYELTFTSGPVSGKKMIGTLGRLCFQPAPGIAVYT